MQGDAQACSSCMSPASMCNSILNLLVELRGFYFYDASVASVTLLLIPLACKHTLKGKSSHFSSVYLQLSVFHYHGSIRELIRPPEKQHGGPVISEGS